MPKPSWRTSASKKERLESLGEERVLLRFRLGSFADSRDPFAVRHQVGNELIPASSRHGTNPQGAHQVTHPPLDGSFPEDRPGEGAPELGGWAHVFNEPPLSERPPGERDQDDPRDPEQPRERKREAAIQTTASIGSRASLKTAPDLNPAHTSQAVQAATRFTARNAIRSTTKVVCITRADHSPPLFSRRGRRRSQPPALEQGAATGIVERSNPAAGDPGHLGGDARVAHGRRRASRGADHPDSDAIPALAARARGPPAEHGSDPRPRRGRIDQPGRPAECRRTGWDTPFRTTEPIGVKATSSVSTASTTPWLTSTCPGSACSAIRAARFTVRPK